MVQEEKKLTGPDLTQGSALDELPDGKRLVGHVGDAKLGRWPKCWSGTHTGKLYLSAEG